MELILTRDLEQLAALTGQTIAAQLPVNPTYLHRSFKMKQNITLEHFITREKIHRAIFILEKNHPISIEDLSRQLGFKSCEDFKKEFEHYLAISPQRYREIRQVNGNIKK